MSRRMNWDRVNRQTAPGARQADLSKNGRLLKPGDDPLIDCQTKRPPQVGEAIRASAGRGWRQHRGTEARRCPITWETARR
jgi:hypothetical protein